MKKSTTGKAPSSKKSPTPKKKTRANKRTEIPAKEARIVYLRSGGVCAFPGCGMDLIEPGTDTDDPSFLGENAHIIADSRQGPRGDSRMSDEDRDKHPNVILLCRNCHKKVDDQPRVYSVSVPRQMKRDYEEKIRNATKTEEKPSSPALTKETIYSSLLPVTHLPDAVFLAKCGDSDRQDELIKQHLIYPDDETELVRFLVRERTLFSFHDLRQPKGPFQSVIDLESVSKVPSRQFWATGEGHRRFLTLLNRALYKYTARKGLRFDPVHSRYYFPIETVGKDREVRYRPLNKRTEKRKVAWRPITEATKLPKAYWCHLAAGLRFHRLAETQWCLSIRPERHLTSDGVTPLPPMKIGRRVTRMKASMFNDKYLSEVNFWRDFLSDGQSRFTLNFGSQSLVVSTEFLTFDVQWAGIPDDEKPFRNQKYEEDLFSTAALDRVLDGEAIDWTEDELDASD